MFLLYLLSKSDLFVYNINDIAVDNFGTVYLATDNKIIAVKTDGSTSKIPTHTSRSFAFTIEDNIIILSNYYDVYKMDFEGNTIEQYPDVDSNTYSTLKKTEGEFITNSGVRYLLKKNLGYFMVIKYKDQTESIVYSISPIVAILKTLDSLLWLFFIFYTLIFVYKNYKATNKLH